MRDISRRQFVLDLQSLLSNVIEYEEHTCEEDGEGNRSLCILCDALDVQNNLDVFLVSILPIEDREIVYD